MVDQNGMLVQFPCHLDQSQPSSWAPEHATMINPGVPNNGFHMPSVYENEKHQEEVNSASACNAVSQEDADGPSTDFPTSDCNSLPEILALGNPQQIVMNAGFASEVAEMLESGSKAKREAIVEWMIPAALQLALSANGTLLIQRALEVTGSDSQIKLSQCLHGSAIRLLDSHHGNHVLQTCIKMMRPHEVQFIYQELSFFRGGWASVACHRFGCRVVERLLEHYGPEWNAPIVAAVVEKIDLLSMHPFANYVVQHILEHVPAHCSQVVDALIQVGVPDLAQHRVASHVVEKAFEHGGAENQGALAEAILSTPYAIVDMGCSRYGNFSVRRMLEALQEPLSSRAFQQLAEDVPKLRASKHGRHIASRVSAALAR